MKRVLATLIFFTRLPFWRIANIEKEYYERVVPLWPLVGWLTGGIMAGVFYVCTFVLPMPIAVIAALVSRVLVTGALHEDGYADFCDGMGGGTSRERILEIMKDSHIGTYGVLGLILYYILMYNILVALFAFGVSPLVFIVADAACKLVSSTIVWFLPYARKAEEAKSRLIYSQTPGKDKFCSIFLGLAPAVVFMAIHNAAFKSVIIAFMGSVFVAAWLFHKMKKSISGYTGDCCGATFIITEFVFYIVFLACLNF